MLFPQVFLVDPLDKNSRELLKMAESFYVHNVPVRIGLVFVLGGDRDTCGLDDAGVALAYAFDYIRQQDNGPKALTFITDVYDGAKGGDITVDMVTKEFKSQFADQDIEQVFGKNSEYDFMKRGGADFLAQAGLQDFPQVLLNGKPLKKSDLNQDNFEEGVIAELMAATPDLQQNVYQVCSCGVCGCGGVIAEFMAATPDLQQNVYQGRLHDGHNTLEWLMKRDNVLPRLNSRVLSGAFKKLDLSESMEDGLTQDYERFQYLSSRDMASSLATDMKYLHRSDEEQVYSVSLWLVTDLQTSEGRSLAYSAFKRLKHSNDMRLGLIFNSGAPSAGRVDLNKAVYVAVNTLSNTLAKNFVTKLVKEENFEELQSGAKTLKDLEVNGMDMTAFLAAYEKQTGDFLRVQRLFSDRVLEFTGSQRGIVANGQVYGPLRDGEVFITEDVDLLELFVKQQSASQLKTELVAMNHTGNNKLYVKQQSASQLKTELVAMNHTGNNKLYVKQQSASTLKTELVAMNHTGNNKLYVKQQSASTLKTELVAMNHTGNNKLYVEQQSASTLKTELVAMNHTGNNKLYVKQQSASQLKTELVAMNHTGNNKLYVKQQSASTLKTELVAMNDTGNNKLYVKQQSASQLKTELVAMNHTGNNKLYVKQQSASQLKTELVAMNDTGNNKLYVKQQFASQLKTELVAMNHTGNKGSDLVMKVAGLLATMETSKTRKKVKFGGDQHSVVKIPADPSRPSFQIEAIVDPVSTAAQKMAPILLVLQELYNLDVRIYMNCKEKLSEMPLKRYYRYVLEAEPRFTSDGRLMPGPRARVAGGGS
ncbi:hypothetical protein DPMN_139111 [Dreissena polymorpha]|uniref:Uncharacterized protein n=1 Tax=Dreissena polymorpha TaxID=45954 RepID=A0A9D4G540_DREPO|nr:hypothetical protein DPMN_139111 [Dreissena polymorpha]